jgi:colanic acid biosynthesis glycosyl transferase WcaI
VRPLTRVAIVSLYYPPATQSNAAIVAAIAEGLAQRGFVVTVVCGTPAAVASAGVAIVRVPFWPRARTLFIARVLSYLMFGLSAGRAVARIGADVVLVFSPPPLLPLFIRAAPSVYAIQDLYPDVITAGTVPLAALVRRALAPIERLARRASRACVVLGPRIASAVARDVGADRVAVIPNPLALAAPQDEEPFEWESTLPGDASMPVVLYAGTLGRTQDFALMLRSARELNSAGVRVAIVGRGHSQGWIDERIIRDRLPLTRRLEPVPSERVDAMFASATVGAVLLRRGIAYASYPSKAATFMAAGRPVIVTAEDDSDIAEAVRAAGAGLVVGPGDDRAFTAAVLELIRDHDRREGMGRAGRAFVLAELDVGRAVARYARVVEAVTTGRPPGERQREDGE